MLVLVRVKASSGGGGNPHSAGWAGEEVWIQAHFLQGVCGASLFLGAAKIK